MSTRSCLNPAPRILAVFLVAVLATPIAHAQENSLSRISLFDGTTLQGWSGDPRIWSVKNNAIVGSSFPDGLSANTFLIAEGQHANFILKLQFRYSSGGSGIQIRSHRIEEPKDFRVAGFQADIGDGDLGTFYEEQGRGTLAASDFNSLRPHLHPDDWNLYEIKAIDNQFTLKINGHTTAQYTEKNPDYPRTGLIALQLQAGAPMRIEFRNIELVRLEN